MIGNDAQTKVQIHMCVSVCEFVTVYTAGFVAPSVTGGGLVH